MKKAALIAVTSGGIGSEFAKIFANKMIKNGGGKILNISSTASFILGSLQATYYTTKAYVTSFLQALFEKLKDKNINITVPCPGAVNADFIKNENLENAKTLDLIKDVKYAALCGYNAIQKDKLIAFNQSKLNLQIILFCQFYLEKQYLNYQKSNGEKSEF